MQHLYDSRYQQNSYPSVFHPISQPTNVNGYDPKSGFNNNNFVNNNQIRHNNQVYPDPFQYTVKFNPLTTVQEIVDGEYQTFEEPNPIIHTSFTNVRYIKLQDMILPMYHHLKREYYMDEDENVTSEWVLNTDLPITENLYTVLSLGGEHADDNYR
jgi:hypothetical protein